MKGLYRLINYEFAAWHRAIALLCLGTVITPLLFLHAAYNDSGGNGAYMRFEDLYRASGCAFVFLIYFLAACAFFLKTFYAGYWRSKSIYTYMTLPVRREALYFSQLIVFSGCLLLLFAAQLVSIRLGYGLVSARAEAYMEGRYAMKNGLFLAVIRSDFLRILFPFSLSRIVSSISLFVAIATGVYYGALCERSRKMWGFVLVGAAILLIIDVLGYRLNESTSYREPQSLIWSSAGLLALSAFFVGHSIRLLRKGTIA